MIILILHCRLRQDVLLPERCSIRVEDGQECQLAPSYVVSVSSSEGEYMIAAVCEDHRAILESKLAAMQKAGKVRQGRINFQPVKMVVTDCVMGMDDDDDYIDIELNRGVESNRKLA